MTALTLVGEDALCCELGKKLVSVALPKWTISGHPVDKRGITRLLPELHRYAQCARRVRPVLCIADTDHKCAVEMRDKWLPNDAPPKLLLRLAVPEAESWVLADKEAVAEFFEVPLNSIPRQPEQIVDPTSEVLAIANRSRKRHLRVEMLGNGNRLRAGPGYNQHLTRLVAQTWDVARAERNSRSLARAVVSIRSLGA